MPTYTVRDPKTGRSLKLTGDSPPTVQELEQIFGRMSAAPPAPAAPPAANDDRSMAADLGIGAAKGAANTSIGLGDLFYRYVPGVGAASRALEAPIANAINAVRGVPSAPGSPPVGASAFQVARAGVQPTNTPQRVGFGAEQLAEFFVPTGAAGRIGQVADIAKAGGLTLAQGGSPTSAGVSAGLTAAVPAAAGVMSALSRRAQQGAEKAVVQALGATKEGMKAEAAKLAPQMLDRGVRGSRAAMLAQARSMTSTVGSQIADEIATAAKAGQTVNGLAIRGAIQEASDALIVKNAKGVRVPIEGAQAVVNKLDKLDRFVEGLGNDIPVDKAAQIKTAWDRLVSKAGLYGNKATASATDNASAWATREGATAFRDMLAHGNPTLAELNKEYSFWKGLRTVLAETERRTQAQASTGLGAQTQGAAPGAIVGTALGSVLGPGGSAIGAGLGAVAGPQLVKAMQSPWWRTTASGPFKQLLADALASGSSERVSRAVGKIVAAMPARMETVAATP